MDPLSGHGGGSHRSYRGLAPRTHLWYHYICRIRDKYKLPPIHMRNIRYIYPFLLFGFSAFVLGLSLGHVWSVVAVAQ